jgi:hypothetical protein
MHVSFVHPDLTRSYIAQLCPIQRLTHTAYQDQYNSTQAENVYQHHYYIMVRKILINQSTIHFGTLKWQGPMHSLMQSLI